MVQNTSSPRSHMVYNIDDEMVPARLELPDKTTIFQVTETWLQNRNNKCLFQICVRDAMYKLIWGTKYMLARNYRKTTDRSSEENLELYNLSNDPGEQENIASTHPEVVEQLKQFGIENYEKMVPPAMGLQHWVIVSFCSF